MAKKPNNKPDKKPTLWETIKAFYMETPKVPLAAAVLLFASTDSFLVSLRRDLKQLDKMNDENLEIINKLTP